ncbi:lactate 2-monooxygenase, partial [Malassezia psittaci]
MESSKLLMETFTKGMKQEKNPFGFTFEDWREKAKEVLPSTSWGYVYGSAGDGATDQRDVRSFKDWLFVPRRLVPLKECDIKPSYKVLGLDVPSPIAVAPIGVNTIFHREGECGMAKGAKEAETTYVMSSATSTSLEDIAKANGEGQRFFQLYWPPNERNDVTASILRRAKENGFTALIVTLDTYVLGYRPMDLSNAYNPFVLPDQTGCMLGMSDPVFRKTFKEKHGKEIEEDMQKGALEWTSTLFSGAGHDWEDLKFLREHWDGPIALKGITSVEDAKLAVKYGMEGIVVSTHGGRQVNGSVSSLEVLPEIVDAVGDKIDVLFDSGIRSGVDVAKALALGAKMVLVGRPCVYGLSIGGSEGVKHVLQCMKADLELSMRLSGVKSIEK